MSTNKARDIMLRALGTDETDDAPFALSIVLQALHAEARVLVDGENLGPEVEHIEFAHANRLKALEEFISYYVAVSWNETAADREAAE